jgi:hypothetical protein
MRKAPSLRSKNGALQVRVRMDGRDVFINRLGRWGDPVAVARAQAISAQIWSDYQEGTFDRSLTAYQPLINGKEVGLLEALRVRAETKARLLPSTLTGCCSGMANPFATAVTLRNSWGGYEQRD